MFRYIVHIVVEYPLQLHHQWTS